MRNAGRLNFGYYPLPVEEGHRLRRLLQGTETFSAIDPCVGTGSALHLITADLPCRRYGVELDAERALAASRWRIGTVQPLTLRPVQPSRQTTCSGWKN